MGGNGKARKRMGYGEEEKGRDSPPTHQLNPLETAYALLNGQTRANTSSSGAAVSSRMHMGSSSSARLATATNAPIMSSIVSSSRMISSARDAMRQRNLVARERKSSVTMTQIPWWRERESLVCVCVCVWAGGA